MKENSDKSGDQFILSSLSIQPMNSGPQNIRLDRNEIGIQPFYDAPELMARQIF
jgi:hypothetical protein